MKTIGLLGGMSWESTASYYRLINEGVKRTLGGLHSAKILLYSVDFEEIEQLQRQGDWQATAIILGNAAKNIERAGAACLLICTNTMHIVADEIESAITIPLLHIADATAAQLRRDGVKRVGLLGTRFTMEQPFYKERLEKRFGIEVLVPDEDQRNRVHDIIYNELCLGEVNESSREAYLSVLTDLQCAGAEAVILGCTEIALLVQQAHTSIPLYDTAALHAARAVSYALAEAD